MKITRIDVYQPKYRLLDDHYTMSRDQVLQSFITNIIRISTDEGVAGYGEVCPLGSKYMEAFAHGVPNGIAEMGEALLGADPCQISDVYARMDGSLSGHNYVKSPIDVACWDIFGKATGRSVATLLGGQHVPDVHLYRAISLRPADEMQADLAKYRAEGYRCFQLKVGGDPNDDIARIEKALEVVQPGDVLVADANTGWITRNALRVANAFAGEDIYIEQPCITLDECQIVRDHTNLPMVIDEPIKGIEPLLEVHRRRLADAVNIKIARVGGLSRAKQLRDLCQTLGIAMTLEDSWGGDIATAAIAHLACSTHPDFFFTSTDFNSYNDVHLAENPPTRVNGRLALPDGPGLGVTVDEAQLGTPVVTIQ